MRAREEGGGQREASGWRPRVKEGLGTGRLRCLIVSLFDSLLSPPGAKFPLE